MIFIAFFVGNDFIEKKMPFFDLQIKYVVIGSLLGFDALTLLISIIKCLKYQKATTLFLDIFDSLLIGGLLIVFYYVSPLGIIRAQKKLILSILIVHFSKIVQGLIISHITNQKVRRFSPETLLTTLFLSVLLVVQKLDKHQKYSVYFEYSFISYIVLLLVCKVTRLLGIFHQLPQDHCEVVGNQGIFHSSADEPKTPD